MSKTLSFGIKTHIRCTVGLASTIAPLQPTPTVMCTITIRHSVLAIVKACTRSLRDRTDGLPGASYYVIELYSLKPLPRAEGVAIGCTRAVLY